MSYADKVFIEMCQEIINNGTSTEGEKVRPVWEDTGESAYTIKKFGVVNRYDLRKEFPAITLRKTALKSAMDEILWIWQKKSNNIKELDSKIWNQWADKDGSIGKAYGYQIEQRYLHHSKLCETFEERTEYIDSLAEYPSLAYNTSEVNDKNSLNINYKVDIYLDQIDSVIYDLKNNPFSRRIMTNIYSFDDLHEMNLYPCAYSMTFNVTSENGELILNGILNQRSQDVLAANNWNVCQYSLLLMMIAQVCNMKAGEFVHVIADAHIYDRHIPLVKELICRESYEAPIVKLNPEIKNFYDFTVNDLIVKDYITCPQIKKIPIAV